MEDSVSYSVRRCPFLHNLSELHGAEFARSVAVDPTKKAPAPQRPILEEGEDLAHTFRLFHGPAGVCPLGSKYSASPVLAGGAQHAAGRCPVTAPVACQKDGASAQQQPRRTCNPLAGAPLAALSLGGLPDFGGLFRHFQQQHRAAQRKPPQQPRSEPRSAGSSSLSSASTFKQPISGPGGAHAGGPAPGSCPLRKALGPFAGVIFNKAGNLQCPEPIIRARAMLAATAPVRELRPQALPVKMVAVGLFTAALNLPCGAWREHTKKFSAEWIMAVHATIPFIAMIRKAVIMPKYAILLTVTAAVVGQAIGARLERARMAAEREYELQQQQARPGAAGASGGRWRAPPPAKLSTGSVGARRMVGKAGAAKLQRPRITTSKAMGKLALRGCGGAVGAEQQLGSQAVARPCLTAC